MPPDIEVPFLAIDEVQLCADFERGHIFTDRVLHRRGTEETMLLGAATMKPILEAMLPKTSFIARPRFSKLTYAGVKKMTRLPRRSPSSHSPPRWFIPWPNSSGGRTAEPPWF